MADPGLVLVWSKGKPVHRAYTIAADAVFTIGRELVPDDDRTSTKHATVITHGDEFIVTDAGSRNGTFVDGDELNQARAAWNGSVVRTGSSLWLAVAASAVGREGRLGIEVIGFVIEEAVRARAAALPIHYSIVQACLGAVWRDRAALATAIDGALDRCLAESADRLRGSHLGAVEPIHAVVPFATYFESELGRPPPFVIPAGCEAHAITKIKGVPHETMIGTDRNLAALTQAQLATALDREPGYFMAGFWGHGVNSYSVYLAQTTARSNIYLRFPYGAGAYSRDPSAERTQTLKDLERYVWLADTLPVAHVTLLDAQGTAYYELVRHDGRVLASPSALSSLREVDFLALAMG